MPATDMICPPKNSPTVPGPLQNVFPGVREFDVTVAISSGPYKRDSPDLEDHRNLLPRDWGRLAAVWPFRRGSWNIKMVTEAGALGSVPRVMNHVLLH
jgi:hypothetical protein